MSSQQATITRKGYRYRTLAWKVSMAAIFLLCVVAVSLGCVLKNKQFILFGTARSELSFSEELKTLQQPLWLTGDELISIEVDATAGTSHPVCPTITLVDDTSLDVVQKAEVSYLEKENGRSRLYIEFDPSTLEFRPDRTYSLRLDFAQCLDSEWTLSVHSLNTTNPRQSVWGTPQRVSMALWMTCTYDEPSRLFLTVGVVLAVIELLLLFEMWTFAVVRVVSGFLYRFFRRVFAHVRAHPFLCSLAYNVGLLLLCYCFVYPANEGTDDFTISALLSGLNGFASPYVLVLGYPLSWLLFQIQMAIPALNWLTMFEMLASLCFFVVLSTVLWEKRAQASVIAGFLVPLICAPAFHVTLNYTRSASMASFAGLLLYVSTVCRRYHSKRTLILRTITATLLCALGAGFRYMCFWLAVPFAGVCWFVYLIQQFFPMGAMKKPRKVRRSFLLRSLLCGAVVLAGVMAVHGWDSYVTSHYGEDMLHYVEYNSVRAKVNDYEKAPYEEVEEDLQKYQITENDYEMISYAMINDSFFSQERMAAILEAQPTKAADPDAPSQLEQTLETYFYRMSHAYLHVTKGTLTFYYVFLLTALIALFFLTKRTVLGYLLIVAGVHVCGFYFLYTGRFPSWVQNSLFLIAIASLLYNMDGHTPQYWLQKLKPRLKAFLCGAGLLAIVVAFFIGNDSYLPRMGETYIQPEGRLLCETLAKRQEDVFILDSTSNIPFVFIQGYGTVKGLPQAGWANIFRCGNWDLEHPVLLEQMKKLGMSSPASQLVDDNVYLVSKKNNFSLPLWQTFLREHYGVETQIVLTEELYGFAIYKFVPIQ